MGQITILMYPIPSRLFTLKLESGLVSMKERELEAWLVNLSFKHKRDFFDYEEVPPWTGASSTVFCVLCGVLRGRWFPLALAPRLGLRRCVCRIGVRRLPAS